MFGLYNRLLSRYPILTQSVQTAILFGTGDVIAQQAVEQKGLSNHDFDRTVRMIGFGGVVAGPVLSTWYRFLEKNVKGSTPFRALATKVAIDQCLFAPLFIGVFFCAQGLFEGKSVDEIRSKLQTNYGTAVISNYKLWPAVQFANFYLIPLNHRLMVTNVVALGWNAYLSLVNQRSVSGTSPTEVISPAT
ncbi:integral membrane protein mpv17 pmp22 family [Radiomyces spectabilis]|uniref:integral membrane protein mpv17 pmp22 family n=1 Tax=Radiomyces spectabilis TaxID=64574 RepID=UPI002220CD94|nr:integral membrane protein mpv17 pmp22 family [Radiomyces spectabilis]KAI8391348.1 integral membrane protein mpv17 pmp22 family [Radiomyces spectabilis]